MAGLRFMSNLCVFNISQSDISFNEIIEIRKIGQGIIIKAENKELKLSPLKKCEEIYNYIKPLVPESITEQQSTSTVDGIKLF